MRIFIILLAIFASVGFAQTQTLPRSSLHFKATSDSTTLSGTKTLGETIVLNLQSNSSAVFPDFINGYPALQIDSAGGYFSFSSNQLAGKNKALFLIVYEPKNSDLTAELGLWSLQNGDRKRFLTSVNVGDEKSRVKYNYFPEAGPNVTTNLVHFQKDNLSDSAGISLVDTFFIAKADTFLFRGKLAEFLVIDTAFTDVERQIWQSYLALKYGVTLYKGDYLNAAGDTLWHYARNRDFAAGTGGIGRDNSIGLSQRFSRIYGDSVTLGFAPISAARGVGGEVQNGEYIFWGHNGAATELSHLNHIIDADYYSLYSRVWKIRPITNNAYSIDFQLNTTQSDNPQNLKLLTSKNADFNALQTSVYSSNRIENQKITFQNILLSDTVLYFTFGYSTNDLPNENGNTNSLQNSSQNPAAQVFTNATWQPNPVVDNLYINYTLTRNATIWFSVHNNIGTPMCQTPPQNRQAGNNQTIIPMSNLIQSTYTVYIHIDDMLLTQVIIKN